MVALRLCAGLEIKCTSQSGSYAFLTGKVTVGLGVAALAVQ